MDLTIYLDIMFITVVTALRVKVRVYVRVQVRVQGRFSVRDKT